MIETTHIRLEQAAAMLDTDTDTLLIAAAEGRVKLYGLAAEYRSAELVRVTDDPFDEANETIVGTRRRFFGFVPLVPWSALVLLKGGEAEVQILTDERALRFEIPFDWSLLPQWGECTDMGYWRDAEGGSLGPLKVGRGSVFVSAESVLDILRTGATPAPGTIKDAPMPDRSHASNWLMLLNQASRRWWANASKDDPTTQPDKADVVAWLIERGMTESLAKHAATIIRPEWAHNGRKPDA